MDTAKLIQISVFIFFYMRSQQGLLQVLKAYTQFRPDEGYCQAQGPVAAVLLMHMPMEVHILIYDKLMEIMACLLLLVWFEFI